MILKRLIFSFYTTKNFEENVVNQFHFKCLERYSSIFNEVIVCIIIDDINDTELIYRTRAKFLKIFNCKIAFKTYANTPYGEAAVFNQEIVNELSSLSGLTFFAHNKGVSNNDNPICDKNSILRWVLGMYYLNLEDIDDVEKCLIYGINGFFYGAYLTEFSGVRNKAHMWYAGTFYWLNAPKIAQHCESNDISIPTLSDRFYAEIFPGSICDWNNGYSLCSKGAKIIYNKNLYINSFQSTEFLIDEGDNAFSTLFNELKADVFPYDYTILTYNFGNYDPLHEILNKQKNIKYICVTDNPSLTSNTWDIVYDDSLSGLSAMEKVYHVRYNCFDYCETSLCVRIDSSIEIRESIDELIRKFETEDKRLAFMVHPRSKTIEDEYDTWINERNLDPAEREMMLKYAEQFNTELNCGGVYEVGFMVIKKDYDTLALNKKMLEGLKWFKDNGINLRVDQVLFSIILNAGFKYLNVLPLSHSVIQSNKLRWYVHGSNDFYCTIPVNSDEGCCFNKLVKLYNWGE